MERLKLQLKKVEHALQRKMMIDFKKSMMRSPKDIVAEHTRNRKKL